jgi:hypothetical protein
MNEWTVRSVVSTSTLCLGRPKPRSNATWKRPEPDVVVRVHLNVSLRAVADHDGDLGLPGIEEDLIPGVHVVLDALSDNVDDLGLRGTARLAVVGHKSQ